MDGHHFNDIVRSLTSGGASRRGITRTLAALSLTGTLSPLFGFATAYAKKKKRKKRCAKRGQRPKKKKRCCKGLSKDTSGRCAKPCDVCQPARTCRYDSVQVAIDDVPPGATLTLCPGIYNETLVIKKNLTLVGMGDGAGPGNTTLDGANEGPVVFIADGNTVTLQNLRITDGYGANGAGIYNLGTLALIGCSVVDNTATFTGGGIYNLLQGTISLINSTVSGNTSTNTGGGIDNFDGTLELIDSSVTANSAGRRDGGIRNGGTVICSGDSTVSGNTAGDPPVPSDCIDVGGTGCAICPV
jgi:hypothetical protein